MKYNKSYDGGTFEEYLIYLNSIKEKISVELFEFVSDFNRHDFSEKSLHDSWIKSITFENDFKNDNNNLKLVFLGENREFILSFQNVSIYNINQSIYDKDLITFEIGIESDRFKYSEEECIVFRAFFSGENNLLEIYAKEIYFSEVLL